MDFERISAVFLAILVSAATMLGNYKNIFVAKNTSRTELLGKLDIAISEKRKSSAAELFRMLYGLRMSYQNMVSLLEEDDFSEIVFALKNMPSSLKYENGKLANLKLNRYPIYLLKGLAFVFAVFWLASMLSLIFVSGSQLIMAIINVLGYSIILVSLRGAIEDQKIVDRLVSRKIK